MNVKHKVSVASYLSDAIERCGKTHRQIAAEAGFPRPYAITTVKSGRTKVPITKVPSLAKVLDIDAKHLLELCFRQYEPGYWEVIEAVFNDSDRDANTSVDQALKRPGVAEWRRRAA